MTAPAQPSRNDGRDRFAVAGDPASNTCDEIILVCDVDGVIQCASGDCREVLGRTPEELRRCSWPDLLGSEESGNAAAELRRLRSGSFSTTLLSRVPVAGGDDREVAWLCCLPDTGQNLMLIVGRDVSRQFERARRQREWVHRYELAGQLHGLIVYEWETEADEVVWGGGFESVLGYRRDELPTGLAGWLELIHPEDRHDAERAAEEVLADQSAAHLTYRVRRADGTWVWIRDDASFVADADGRLVRMIGTLREVPVDQEFDELSRLIVTSTPTGILAVDAAGRILFSNPHLQETFGYTGQELEGQMIEVLLPERLRERHFELRQVWQANPTPRPMGSGLTLFGRRKDGSEFPVDIALNPTRTRQGPVVLCTVADRTERLAAENAIRERDHRLRDILDNTSAVMYLKDLDGRYLLANRQWEVLFRIDRQKMIGQTDFELFPEHMARAFRENDELVARSGEVHEFEESAPHADGPHTYLSLKFPLRRSNGEIYGIGGISTDISERIEAERENEWLKHRLELILNSIGDGLYGVDCDGTITFANFAAARMLGWNAEELCGQDHHAVSHDPLNDRVRADSECRVCKVSREGVETDVEEEQFRRKDGSLFPVEYTSTPVFDEGSIVGSVVTFRDISERIRREQAEEELRTAQAVQQLLYPRTSPTLNGVDIAGATHPAAMACGDYFDFIRTGSDEMVLALGDVSGHGLGPALQMVEARAYLRATINAESDERQVLTQLNRLLVEDTPVESFLTLVLARIDARSRSFCYAGAGHNAYLMRSNGQIEDLPSTGIVLGLISDFDMTVSERFSVGSGDLLLLLSDGLQETMSPQFELFGMDRALDLIREHRHRPSAEIIERLYRSSRDFACEDSPRDDITVVIARFL
ncbi:Phosphoserine phosphatase RsbU [Maioricimonas rarisocia]|uniref:Phosphoserine phosphatase RsbU n=1 Tax=Maioricimonas rarisocia TaxID=2528026 RepID=A0A517Z6D9_9PLAN|nr:PAS domain S-box protein [Maioricimonas rarisocia]QDU38060.1 Phosphoserine phosphatase RsbU [Maioricimonas rarisocia]